MLVIVACNGSRPREAETPAPCGGWFPGPRFIEDDYPKALAEAKARKKPLFVDAWAPWCHSCQSLRAFVLTDRMLDPLANDLEMKRLDDADKAADRAVGRVYGPRAMRVFALKADIAKARGDRAGEAKALEEALARSEASVLTQGQRAIREGLVKRLAALR